MINFSKTCLSLDGTEERRGGQPEIKQTSTASWQPWCVAVMLPARPFQFQTKAVMDEGQHLQNEVFVYCPQMWEIQDHGQDVLGLHLWS